MEDRRRRRRGAPKRTLIGPLVMLAGGVVAGGVIWHVLMLEPPRTARTDAEGEQISQPDRQALDRLLAEPYDR